MAKISFPGLAQYEFQLSTLFKNTEKICDKAVYEGASIVADAIRENIKALPAVNDVEGTHAWAAKREAPLTKKAKQGLLDGFGVSPLRDDSGYRNVKLGFDGYNKLKTRQYPKGQPNVLIARVTESGKSVSEKRPFVRPAVRATRKIAEEKMAEVLDEELEKIMK